METPTKTKVRAVAKCVGLLSLLLALGSTAPAFATAGDAWITTKVKLTLLTREGIDSRAVNADTLRGQVTLHGIVDSAAEREAAEHAAREIDGVQSVRNLLQVVPRNRQAAVVRSDDEIATQIGLGFRHEDSLTDSKISVQSVNNGVVLLNGTAADLADLLTAVQLAGSVAGVRRVASEIRSPDKLAEDDLWKDATVPGEMRQVPAEPDVTADRRDEDSARVSETVRAATGAAADLYITSMVKLRLLADDTTPALDINVDTDKGKVTLFGIVPTAEARLAAQADAGKVTGVKLVKNELQVVAAAAQPFVEAKDKEIETSLKRSLEERAALHDIEVDVKNCVARLTGSVPSGIELVEAMQVARATRGVCSVRDEMRLQN
jgi:hyperosmotically inducible protein